MWTCQRLLYSVTASTGVNLSAFVIQRHCINRCEPVSVCYTASLHQQVCNCREAATACDTMSLSTQVGNDVINVPSCNYPYTICSQPNDTQTLDDFAMQEGIPRPNVGVHAVLIQDTPNIVWVASLHFLSFFFLSFSFSFVVVIVAFFCFVLFCFWGEGGWVGLVCSLKKIFFWGGGWKIFNVKCSVMLLCCYYYMCMFV